MHMYSRRSPYEPNLEFRLELKIVYQIHAEKDIHQKL